MPTERPDGAVSDYGAIWVAVRAAGSVKNQDDLRHWWFERLSDGSKRHPLIIEMKDTMKRCLPAGPSQTGG